MTRLESYVKASDVFVPFVTSKYLSSSSCRRELVAAMDAKKPMVMLVETDSKEGSIAVSDSTQFQIPELPRGRSLVINILSTWGDPHYVGLMGIEIFDGNGHLVTLSNTETQLMADPADINVLAEYANDPRTVDKLLDGDETD